MRHAIVLLPLALALAACSGPDASSDPAPTEVTAPATEPTEVATKPQVDPLRRAVDAPERPADDRARDADRKPYEVMRFFEIEPGDTVADLMAGSGYYTELLARAVGPKGKVYAQNTPLVLKKFAEGPLSERLARPGLEQVERVDASLEAPGFAPNSLDAALMVLFYHDTYWQGIDREAMNRAIFEALKPGGVYGIVDHHAEEGSGVRDVKSLHRVDVELVKRELQEAGFVLEESSDALRHPEDPRTQNVFDEAIRGKTDRFILRFRKPR